MRLLTAITICLLGCGATGSDASSREEHRISRATIATVVAARDLATGDKVEARDLTEAELPLEWVTKSMIPPDSTQNILGQRILVPTLAGDPLLWPAFGAVPASSEVLEACLHGSEAPRGAPDQVAVARQNVFDHSLAADP